MRGGTGDGHERWGEAEQDAGTRAGPEVHPPAGQSHSQGEAGYSKERPKLNELTPHHKRSGLSSIFSKGGAPPHCTPKVRRIS